MAVRIQKSRCTQLLQSAHRVIYTTVYNNEDVLRAENHNRMKIITAKDSAIIEHSENEMPCCLCKHSYLPSNKLQTFSFLTGSDKRPQV